MPHHPRTLRRQLQLISALILGFGAVVGFKEVPSVSATPPEAGESTSKASQGGTGNSIFLPLITKSGPPPQGSPEPIRLVNLPYFGSDAVAQSHFTEMAIFWFGQVQHPVNYADVRLGYNNTGLTVFINVIDRRLWYDDTPAASDFQKWDTVSLYVDTSDSGGVKPGPSAYRFDAMLNWWETRQGFQAGYRGNGTAWAPSSVNFSAISGWRGNAPLDNVDDHGWSMRFEIPFASLGLTSPPGSGQTWRFGLEVFDRDDGAGTPIPTIVWPETLNPLSASSWGKLSFGLPVFNRPTAAAAGSIMIRNHLDGAFVKDGHVGGDTSCGGSSDYWNGWGNNSYPGIIQINIQNQGDVADFPCFSKYYVTFPLDQLPSGKQILDAKLTLHQFGNSDPSAAQPSLIQVMTIREDWSEDTLSWNNAPIPQENVSQQWVNKMTEPLVWPGVAHTWDLSRAVAQAYADGEPLRLVLYSADWAMHSGKYFISSDGEEWNAAARPTLDVTWGNP